jgi:hypothetical protein
MTEGTITICGTQRALIQGPRCNEPMRPLPLPGVFPGVKGSRCVRLTTLPPSCAVVMKSGNLNFLEPSGPLQVCNGAALLYSLD